MPDIKVKGYSGNDLVYQNVDKIYFRKSDDSGNVPFTHGEAVIKTVEPDFSSGDMSVDIAEGELVTEMTIVKPVDLAAENIPKDMYIAGVGPGEFIGDIEEVTVALNMVGGDQIIVPSAEGKVLSKVTVLKPADLQSGNIAKDKEIGGYTGTLEVTSGVETVIEPDFSGGNMEVTPTEGTHFSKVTVEMPDNLTPENIPEGMYIAGVGPGEFAGGGTSAIQHFSISKSLSVGKSSAQKTAIVLPAADLPDWWPAAGSMVAHAYNKTDPIYIAILVRISGTTGSAYLESAMLTNYTNNATSTGRGGWYWATSTGTVQGFNANVNYWNYTPASYNGLFQDANGIGWAAYNNYGACSGVYRLTLLKIDPYSA